MTRIVMVAIWTLRNCPTKKGDLPKKNWRHPTFIYLPTTKKATMSWNCWNWTHVYTIIYIYTHIIIYTQSNYLNDYVYMINDLYNYGVYIIYYIYIHIHIYIYIHTHIQIQIHIHTYNHIDIYIYIYTHIQIQIQIHIHTYRHIHIHIHIHIHT